MAPTAKIELDPPGTIGLAAGDAIVYLRFDEPETAIPAKDDAGSLNDLTATGLVMPPVTTAVLGKGRSFSSIAGTGMLAKDIDSGASLATRDCSIQVVLSWSLSAQDPVGPGTIVARGDGSGLVEYTAYGLRIGVTDLSAFTGEVAWFWQDIAGVDKLQIGALFTLSSGFTMLTATRRWVSPTEVSLRYYIGDVLLGEVTSIDGSIGGGTTGTFQVGHNAGSDILCGIIDELAVFDRELAPEEIGATWLRITQDQPRGYQLFRELHDQGFPMSADPASDVQLETRMIGTALGYASGQAENLRRNFIPSHAYGATLEQWEELTLVTQQPAGTLDERRERVLSRFRQRLGSSIPGMNDILSGLLGGGSIEDLEYLAFTNDIFDDFTTLETLRWDFDGAFWQLDSGRLRMLPPAVSGTYLLDDNHSDWTTCSHAIGGDGKRAHMIGKIAFTSPVSGAEVGIYFGNFATHDYALLGLRDVAGVFTVVFERFIGHISQGTFTTAIGANPTAIWFHLAETSDGVWSIGWSTVSPSDIVLAVPFGGGAWAAKPNQGGFYFRSTGSIGRPTAHFDDSHSRAPFGSRPFNAYALLDEGLGFDPDIDGAHSVIQAIKHGFIEATFITHRAVRCDEPFGCDRGPMGAL